MSLPQRAEPPPVPGVGAVPGQVAWPGRWRMIGFLAFAAAINYADRTAISAVLAPIRAEFGLSDAALGLVGSIFLWSYAISSPVAGLVADRYPRPRIVLYSLFLWSAVTAITGIANGLVMLCVLRVALGAFESLFHPSAFALAAEHHGAATRAKAMCFLSLGFQSGIVIGGAAAGYLAEKYSWRLGFVALGAGGIGVACVAKYFLPPISAAGIVDTRAPVMQSLKYLTRVPSFHLFLAKAMLIGGTTFVFFAWLPLYLLETYHMKLGAAGFLGTFMLQVTKVVGIAAGGWASDLVGRRAGRRRILLMAFCYLAAAPFLLVFLDQHTLWFVALALGGFSLFNGAGLANEQPALCEIVPSQFRSTAIGVYNTCATAAGGVGVLFAGVVKQDWGLQTVFASASLVYVAAWAMLIGGYCVFLQRDIERATRFERQGVGVA